MSTNDSNLSRRSFVKRGIAAAVVASAAPHILHAEDKTMTKPLVIGQGAYKYEVIDEWAKLPEGKKFGNTHGVCETADGRIFIHSPSPTGDAVVEYEPDGKFIRSWGEEFKKGAHGMQLHKEGSEEFLYFATTSQRTVVKTNLKGEHVFLLEYPKDAKNAAGEPCYAGPEKYCPTNIAFHPTDGSFYVADGYGSNYVHHYSAKGEYISTWGGAGKGEGQLQCPHGIWCDTRDAANPMILVADRSNVRLQWFTLDGKFIKMVTDELRAPCHFDQRNGDILIPDLKGRVTIFDKDNKLIVHLGDNPNENQRANNGVKKEDLTPGQFCNPHQAIWDRAGNIYVAEWLPYGRVTKLRLLT